VGRRESRKKYFGSPTLAPFGLPVEDDIKKLRLLAAFFVANQLILFLAPEELKPKPNPK